MDLEKVTTAIDTFSASGPVAIQLHLILHFPAPNKAAFKTQIHIQPKCHLEINHF